MQVSGSNTRRPLLLPLRRGIGNECRLIFESDGRRVAEADGPNEGGLIVDAVNRSSELTDAQKTNIVLARDREWSNRLQAQDTIHPDSTDFDLAIAWYTKSQKSS